MKERRKRVCSTEYFIWIDELEEVIFEADTACRTDAHSLMMKINESMAWVEIALENQVRYCYAQKRANLDLVSDLH